MLDVSGPAQRKPRRGVVTAGVLDAMKTEAFTANYMATRRPQARLRAAASRSKAHAGYVRPGCTEAMLSSTVYAVIDPGLRSDSVRREAPVGHPGPLRICRGCWDGEA